VRRLLALAMRVEFFGGRGNLRGEGGLVGEVGEGERFEAAAFVVARVVTDT
jgi:hypothetical protein